MNVWRAALISKKTDEKIVGGAAWKYNEWGKKMEKTTKKEAKMSLQVL